LLRCCFCLFVLFAFTCFPFARFALFSLSVVRSWLRLPLSLFGDISLLLFVTFVVGRQVTGSVIHSFDLAFVVYVCSFILRCILC